MEDNDMVNVYEYEGYNIVDDKAKIRMATLEYIRMCKLKPIMQSTLAISRSCLDPEGRYIGTEAIPLPPLIP